MTDHSGELREQIAREIYDELEGPVADQDFGRQVRQWQRCEQLADRIIALLPPPPNGKGLKT